MASVPTTFEVLDSKNQVISRASSANISDIVDVSDLSAEKRAMLISSAEMFVQSHNRLNSELFMMSSHLATCKEILGEDRFYIFAEQGLGFSRKRANRLLKIYSVLDKHFRESDGKFHPAKIVNFSDSALLMLADDSEGELVDVLKNMAETGKVNATIVKELVDRRAAQNDSSYAAIAAELEQEKRLGKERGDKAELEMSRMRDQFEAQAETVRRLTDQIDAQDEDMRRLQEQARQQAPKIVEKEVRVEVVPPEYKDKKEALAGIESELHEMAAKRKRAAEELATAQAKLAEMNQSMATRSAGADQLARLRAKLSEVEMMFPGALLASIKSTDESVKDEVAAIGEMLVRIGNQFKGA